jgi:hypothetical protein
MTFCLSAVNSETGTVCVAPIAAHPDPRSGANIEPCLSQKLFVKIDSRESVQFSKKQSLKIDGLDLAAQHRVVIYCAAKPQQSFSFRFSDFQGSSVCLFINDLYKTAQLWEPERSPWCKCR